LTRFARHQQRRETQDALRIERGQKHSKQRVEQSLRQWSGKVGYAAETPATLFAIKLAVVVVFPDHPEVPPDNTKLNVVLRLAVTKRKVCGGSRSMDRFAQLQTCLGVADKSCSGAFGHRVFSSRC